MGVLPHSTLFSHDKYTSLNFIFIAFGVDQCVVYVGYACSVVIGLAGQNGVEMKQC